MRITGGRARGISLKVPSGDGVRPATDRTREALFSSLGDAIEGARFLDLFAGAGSYGLEALSRGAAGGTFVEKDRRALEALRANLQAVVRSAGISAEQGEVVGGDVQRFQTGEKFSVIFVDPPYPLWPSLLPVLRIRWQEWIDLDAGAWICAEHPAHFEVAGAGWHLRRRLGKGSGDQPVLSILEWEGL